MKSLARLFIISGIIGAILSVTGLFFLGLAIGYNQTHSESQHSFVPIGIMLLIFGGLTVTFSSFLYKKKAKSFTENSINLTE